MSSGGLAQIIVGPRGHGVVEAAFGTLVGPHSWAPTLMELDLTPVTGADVVHLHYTDRLYGPTCELAAANVTGLMASLERPVVVTLHDLPMPGPDVAQWRRRAAAYSVVVEAAAGVVVSSRWELGLLGRLLDLDGAPSRPTAVIPLAIDPAADPSPGSGEGTPESTGEVAVLGWIYPGKGHDVVAAALPPGAGLAALGEVSPGHADLLADLRTMLGDRLRCTGFLPDTELTAELRRIAVPVAAHRNVSASASIGSWLAAGRRPLVADGGWARELAERCPGAITLVGNTTGAMREAIAAALANPVLTWLGDTPVGPGTAEVTRALQAFCVSLL